MKPRVWTLTIVALMAISEASAQERGGEAGGKPPTREEWVRRLDRDGDGKIAVNEFDGPAEHFAHFDRNGDGYIDATEAPNGPPPKRRMDERRDPPPGGRRGNGLDERSQEGDR